MLNLSKIFEVPEDVEFMFDGRSSLYKIINNKLLEYNGIIWCVSYCDLNTISKFKTIRTISLLENFNVKENELFYIESDNDDIFFKNKIFKVSKGILKFRHYEGRCWLKSDINKQSWNGLKKVEDHLLFITLLMRHGFVGSTFPQDDNLVNKFGKIIDDNYRKGC